MRVYLRKYEIGTKIGNYTIIDFIPKGKWVLQCTCGFTSAINSSNVKMKEENLANGIFVGCMSCARIEHKSDVPDSRYYSIPIRQYKRRAKKKECSGLLTNEDLCHLFKSNCYYCDSLPKNSQYDRYLKKDIIYQGIDRKDNNSGYTKENVVPCCKICNYGKFIMSKEEYITHCEKIVLNNVQRLSEASE